MLDPVSISILTGKSNIFAGEMHIYYLSTYIYIFIYIYISHISIFISNALSNHISYLFDFISQFDLRSSDPSVFGFADSHLC